MKKKLHKSQHFVPILLWFIIGLPFVAIVVGIGGGLHILTISHLMENIRKEGLNDVIVIYIFVWMVILFPILYFVYIFILKTAHKKA